MICGQNASIMRSSESEATTRETRVTCPFSSHRWNYSASAPRIIVTSCGVLLILSPIPTASVKRSYFSIEAMNRWRNKLIQMKKEAIKMYGGVGEHKVSGGSPYCDEIPRGEG